MAVDAEDFEFQVVSFGYRYSLTKEIVDFFVTRGGRHFILEMYERVPFPEKPLVIVFQPVYTGAIRPVIEVAKGKVLLVAAVSDSLRTSWHIPFDWLGETLGTMNQNEKVIDFDKVSYTTTNREEFEEDPVINEFIRSVSSPMIKSADKMGLS